MEEEKVSKRQLILVGIAVLLTGILLIVKPSHSVFQVNKTINIMDAKVGDFGSKEFIKNFGGSGWDEFQSAAQTSDGGYIAVGRSNSTDGDLVGLNKGDFDAIIVKFNSRGDVVWNKNFGGSSSDTFYSVSQTSDGGYIAVGKSNSTNGDLTNLNKGNYDGIIVKYDSSGNVVWNKNFGGSSPDNFISVQVTLDGGYIAVGGSSSNNGDLTGLNKGSDDAIIVKYDASGNVIWNKNFGGSGSNDSFNSIVQISDGSYVAAGFAASVDGDLTGLNKGSDDATIVKYDSSGNLIWNKNFGGSSYDNFVSVQVTSDGGYIAVGQSMSTDGDLTGLNKGGVGNDAIIVKYDSSGNVIWNKNFGGNAAETFTQTSLVSAGGYMVVGTSSSSTGDLTGLNKGYTDGIFVKYDINGIVEWKNNFGGSSGEYIYGGIVTTDGSFMAVGSSPSTDGDLVGLNKGQGDAIIVKVIVN